MVLCVQWMTHTICRTRCASSSSPVTSARRLASAGESILVPSRQTVSRRRTAPPFHDRVRSEPGATPRRRDASSETSRMRSVVAVVMTSRLPRPARSDVADCGGADREAGDVRPDRRHLADELVPRYERPDTGLSSLDRVQVGVAHPAERHPDLDVASGRQCATLERPGLQSAAGLEECVSDRLPGHGSDARRWTALQRKSLPPRQLAEIGQQHPARASSTSPRTPAASALDPLACQDGSAKPRRRSISARSAADSGRGWVRTTACRSQVNARRISPVSSHTRWPLVVGSDVQPA
jgi:hypothetical protein